MKEISTVEFDVELTDTFGGEANYSWVKRQKISVPVGASDRSIVIAAKKAIGRTGCKADTDNSGGVYTIRFRGRCEVAFITFNEGL